MSQDRVATAAIRLAGLLERIRDINEKLCRNWCENVDKDGEEFRGEFCFSPADTKEVLWWRRFRRSGRFLEEDDYAPEKEWDESKFCPACLERLRLVEERHALRAKKGSAIAAVTRSARAWARGLRQS
jgi:hypothetical protein